MAGRGRQRRGGVRGARIPQKLWQLAIELAGRYGVSRVAGVVRVGYYELQKQCGLAALCRAALGEDPFRGTVFVFRNRRGTTLQALAYDGQGFWLCQKRLSEGRFRWWPSATDQRVLSASLQFLVGTRRTRENAGRCAA